MCGRFRGPNSRAGCSNEALLPGAIQGSLCLSMPSRRGCFKSNAPDGRKRRKDRAQNAVVPARNDKEPAFMHATQRCVHYLFSCHPHRRGCELFSIGPHSVVKFRIGISRAQRLNINLRANAAQFEVKRFGEDRHPAFRRAVAGATNAAHESCDGRHIDQSARIPRYHIAKRNVTQSHCRRNVQLMHPFLTLQRRFPEQIPSCRSQRCSPGAPAGRSPPAFSATMARSRSWLRSACKTVGARTILERKFMGELL
jgi:hypothetical protein